MTLLLDAGLRATVILGAAWLAAWALRSASADERRHVWIAAFAAAAALPLYLALAARWRLPALSAFRVATLDQTTAAITRSSRTLPWVPWIWAAGSLVVLARLLRGWTMLVSWTREATRLDGLLYSDRIGVPITFGVWRPVILLPAYAQTWSDEERAIVLSHEQAHIDHHDWFWRVLARITTAVFWFHPLFWIAEARLRHEAERAADDRVLAGGTQATDYAERLMAVARQVHGAAPAGAVAMVQDSLERRIEHILDPAKPRSLAGRRLIVGIAIAAGLGVSLAAAQGQRIYRTGDADIVPPRLVHEVKPGYGPRAMADKAQGQVFLSAEISETGVPENVVVTTSLHEELDQNAVEAVKQWGFEPGTKDGTPVRVIVEVEIRYTLR